MEKRAYYFEKLEVWQKSRELIKNVYLMTKSFPKDEQFGLSSQIQRAAVSIASNIAEGTSRQSHKDKCHFLEIAYGSLMEVYNQYYIACDLGYIEEDAIDQIYPLINEISNKLNALSSTLKEKEHK